MIEHKGSSPFSQNHDEEQELEADVGLLSGGQQSAKFQPAPRQWLWIWYGCQVVLLILNITFFAFNLYSHSYRPRACLENNSAWSPALDAVEYQSKSLFNESRKYSGVPTPAIESAWQDLVNERIFTLSKEEVVEKLGKSANAVHFPEKEGGEYIGYLEVFHQLHCTNVIRKFVYRDHYQDDAILQDTEVNIRKHLDHCLEIIRTNIMCQSDVSVLTYTWSDKKDVPNPNFNVIHRCRNFNKIVDWNRNSPRASSKTPKKPSDPSF